jgi:hypothetical protein
MRGMGGGASRLPEGDPDASIVVVSEAFSASITEAAADMSGMMEEVVSESWRSTECRAIQR